MTMNTAKRANESRWTILNHDPDTTSAKGTMPESWLCVDCGTNTAPNLPDRKQAELAFALYGGADCRYDHNT
jgi:hypothetical protein